MKQVSVTGVKQAAVSMGHKPRAKDNWVVVRVMVAPMCTEYKAFATGASSPVYGHEAAGEVVEVAQPGRVQVGDRVVVMPMNSCGSCAHCLDGEYIHCQDGSDFATLHGGLDGLGTMAQYLIKQDWMLLPIPNGMSYARASMACCGLGPTFGAFQKMALDRHDTVLITGLGPVGLGGIVNARYRGARVIGVESNPYRAELARELGAEAVVDPMDDEALEQILAMTKGGRGIDKAVDCAGVVGAHRLCIDAARRRGSVAFVGECSDDTPLHISNDMIRKGLNLIGSWHFNMADSPRMMAMIGEIGGELDRLITHRFSIDDIQAAWDTQLSGECGKVLLQPWEGSDV